jgi:triacylglycerol lipase
MTPSSSRNPVLLVHGIDDTTTLFWKMAPYLSQQGWSVHSLDLKPNDGRLGLDKLADQVAEYAAQNFAQQPFDLVGFSMGGIVSRYYVQRLGGLKQVQRLITIASPHHGTWMAYFRPNLGGSQMRRDSVFLADLNRDMADLDQLNFTSIWTQRDLMIVPAASSRMAVGKNIQIPVSGHAWMVTDPRSLKALAAALSEPLRNNLVQKTGCSEDRAIG